MAEEPQLYINFGKDLYRLTTEKIDIPSDIDPSRIISGSSISTVSQSLGLVFSGKTGFTNDETGYIIGLDKGIPKEYIGTPTSYFNFDGTNVIISGTSTVITGVLNLVGTLQLKSFTVATLPIGNTGLLSAGGISGTIWTNPIKAYSSNNDWATTSTGGIIQTYKTWGLGSIPTQIIPLGSTILGIDVKAEGHGDAADMQIAVRLSWDSGITWTNHKVGTPANGADAIVTFGGTTELWGHTWLWSETTDDYVYAQIQCSDLGSGTTYELDHLQLRIYYTDPKNPITVGSVTYASDGRKAGEGAGNGTGVLVFYDSAGNWIACDTGATVAA